MLRSNFFLRLEKGTMTEYLFGVDLCLFVLCSHNSRLHYKMEQNASSDIFTPAYAFFYNISNGHISGQIVKWACDLILTNFRNEQKEKVIINSNMHLGAGIDSRAYPQIQHNSMDWVG